MAMFLRCVVRGERVADRARDLVGNMALYRRMTPLVRMAVASGMEAAAQTAVVAGSSDSWLEAIISATGLGLVRDSEAFLRSFIETGNDLLNPTPFIQSTFNIVGANLALLLGFHGANSTHSHDGQGFFSALEEADLHLAGAPSGRYVLLSVFDEQVEAVSQIRAALHCPTSEPRALAFLLTNQPQAGDLAISLSSHGTDLGEGEFHRKYAAPGANLYHSKGPSVEPTIHAHALANMAEALHREGKSGRAVYYYQGDVALVIELECC